MRKKRKIFSHFLIFAYLDILSTPVERRMFRLFVSIPYSPFPSYSSHFRENLALCGMILFSWKFLPRAGVGWAGRDIIFSSSTSGLHPGHIILSIKVRTIIIDCIPVPFFMMNKYIIESKSSQKIVYCTESLCFKFPVQFRCCLSQIPDPTNRKYFFSKGKNSVVLQEGIHIFLDYPFPNQLGVVLCPRDGRVCCQCDRCPQLVNKTNIRLHLIRSLSG